jgi:hypothetical protein
MLPLPPLLTYYSLTHLLISLALPDPFDKQGINFLEVKLPSLQNCAAVFSAF